MIPRDHHWLWGLLLLAAAAPEARARDTILTDCRLETQKACEAHGCDWKNGMCSSPLPEGQVDYEDWDIFVDETSGEEDTTTTPTTTTTTTTTTKTAHVVSEHAHVTQTAAILIAIAVTFLTFSLLLLFGYYWSRRPRPPLVVANEPPKRLAPVVRRIPRTRVVQRVDMFFI